VRRIRLTNEQLLRFAESSGDRNPLHIDERFARRTPYGRRIAHGALVATAALGSANEEALLHATALELQFKKPVVPDEEYTVGVVETSEDKVRIDVVGGGHIALSVEVTVDHAAVPLPSPTSFERPGARLLPCEYTLEQLTAAELAITEPFAADVEALSTLAADLGAAHVPAAILAWLAAASFTVGMLVPGRDGLFARARITRASASASSELAVSVTAADDRTGFVSVEGLLADGSASAEMALQTFLLPPVPAPNRKRTSHFLPPSAKLEGRTAFVVGASRGLGAALAGALSTQGATVWAGFAESTEQAQRLRHEFGQERIRLLQFDAANAEETAAAFEAVRAEGGQLDGVVLSAAPPPGDTILHPDATRATLDFVSTSIAMALVPLTEALRLLSADGWLVVISSSALDDPPVGWPHYVVAKAALEGAAAYCARQTPARVIVVRAPRMWTDSMNTPMGRSGAAEKEKIAAAIVRQILAGDATGCPQIVTPDELAEGFGTETLRA
jgi:NAD(P)-dependent dehydrogenase (short-subunit alcohol dehydrogenase family)/acyl dehydratase